MNTPSLFVIHHRHDFYELYTNGDREGNTYDTAIIPWGLFQSLEDVVKFVNSNFYNKKS